MGGPCDIPNTDCEPGKPRWLAKETQKKCHIKLFRLPRGRNSVTLSESPHESIHTYCSVPPNKHFICFTTFCLCGNSFLQSQEARVLSLTTGLVVSIWCFHCCDPDSVSGRWAQTPLQAAAYGGPPRSDLVWQLGNLESQGKPWASVSCHLRPLTFTSAFFLSSPLGFLFKIKIMLGWQLMLSSGTRWKHNFQLCRSPKGLCLSLALTVSLSLTVLCETLHYSFLFHFTPTTSYLSHSLSPSYNILLLEKDFLDIIPKLHPSLRHTLCYLSDKISRWFLILSQLPWRQSKLFWGSSVV